MNFLRSLVIVAIYFSETSFLFAQTAPFGLSWGMSAQDVKTAGAELEPFDAKDYGSSFIVKNLPAALSDQENTVLWFGHDDKLWRVIALGRAVANDPFGLAVRARYDELTSALNEKYGKGSPYHNLGSSIYKEPRYFLAGIRGGESRWLTVFKAKEVDVELGIIAADSSTGNWRIIFENKDLRRAFDASKKGRERKAL